MKRLHPYTASQAPAQDRNGAIAMARPHDIGHGWRRDIGEAMPNFDKQASWRQNRHDLKLRLPTRGWLRAK
jgi:hypothetical protein